MAATHSPPLLGPKSAWPTFAMLAKVMGWMEEEEGEKIPAYFANARIEGQHSAICKLVIWDS